MWRIKLKNVVEFSVIHYFQLTTDNWPVRREEFRQMTAVVSELRKIVEDLRDLWRWIGVIPTLRGMKNREGRRIQTFDATMARIPFSEGK